MDLDLDEEDEKTSQAKKTPEDGNLGEDGQETDGENKVQVPEEMPEDAFFIPLGITRQRPQEFYKGSDPEWQSFIEFRKDPGREEVIRSEQCLRWCVGPLLTMI